MQIVIDHDGSQHEFDLQIEDPTACVSDLLRLAAPAAAAGTGVAVEDRFFGSGVQLDEIGLSDGAVVRVTRVAPVPTPSRPGGPALVIIGGPVAGGIHPLDGTAVTIGRSPDCDVMLDDDTLSQRHARLRRQPDGTVAVTDLESRNGTWVDGVPVRSSAVVPPGALLRFGATHARVVADLPDDRPFAIDPHERAAGGLVPFNRPPRPALPEAPSLLEPPEPPKEPARTRAVSILQIVAPLVIGGVLVIVMQDPRFALFLLLSPVMAIGNWWASTRQAAKEQRESSDRFQQALETFGSELEAACVAEIRRRDTLLPDTAETLRRARLPSIRLWQRRPQHDDFLRLRAGIGDVPWAPPVAEPRGSGLTAEVAEIAATHRLLRGAPVEVDLSDGGVVGIVGERACALALARSLVCQAAVHHGPADLGIAVLASEPHAPDWDWAKWLPHVRDPVDTARMLASNRAASDDLLAELTEDSASGRTRLVVLDDISLVEGRRAPARLLLSGHASGIIVAARADQLPAVCTTVITMRSDLGNADLCRPQQREQVDDFVLGGVAEPVARDAARALARFEDPELELVGAGLPQVVRLLPLLGMDEIDADIVRDAWAQTGVDPAPNTPIGIGEHGVVHLDLVRDGPHGLIGGTTGSGKSELLRSIVAGMAARLDPDQLVFVLVDYKGGSAFDECARLPHTVGMVTDLDGHLGERALRSLEAELRHRERLLREAGTSDLPTYRRAGAPLGPLPRLAVVIDEFATLATELPDFVGALVGIAQRGRSLGVHLILATQRPAGVVNANIKANTNLRIALRVQDPTDSADIIDRTDAALIAASNPGRAYVRLGPTDVVLVQTALSTAAKPERRPVKVRLAPFGFGRLPSAPPPSDHSNGGHQPSDLARLVDAVQQAFERSGMAPPREPWLPMLPERVPLEAVLDASGDAEIVPFALADDPEHQRRIPIGWTPSAGHLALFGMVGSGTTTAMLAVARALAERATPDKRHLYVIDARAGGLSVLAALPHVGTVITANEHEAQERLLRYLRGELDRRRGLTAAQRAAEPQIVVLVDGIGAFLAEHDRLEGTELSDAFHRVFAEGTAVGIAFVVTADRPGALPTRLGALVSQKLLFRLADPGEFTVIGLRPKELPAFVPGRAIHAESRLVVQVGHPGGDLEAIGKALGEQDRASRPPIRIGALPAAVPYARLVAGARLEPSRVNLTVGIADADLGPAVLTLRATDHVLVAGPPQSGKSMALMLIAALLRDADPGLVLVGVCDDRSPLEPVEALDAAGPLPHLAHVVRAGLKDPRRWFVLVDDAPLVEDVEGVLSAALRPGRPGLHVVAAGRSDDLRAYGHWTGHLRQTRTGILLQPDLTADGALLATRLPRRVSVPLVPGRGFLVTAGTPSLAQLALPPEMPTYT